MQLGMLWAPEGPQEGESLREVARVGYPQSEGTKPHRFLRLR